MFTLADIRLAATRLERVAHRTPIFTSSMLNARVGAKVFVKAESFQRTGSFKFRGAYNALAALSPPDRERGVCAISTGNHGQALALAARLFRTHAVILMHDDAPPSKRIATADLGAEVMSIDSAEDPDELLRSVAGDRGLVVVHAHDDYDVIAGQGTVALELLEDVADIDLLVIQVSGGGLVSGCATAAKALDPRMTVVGVEPVSANDTKRSLEAGRRIRIESPTTIAEGLGMSSPGLLTFPIITRVVDDVILVSDREIIDAMIFLFDRMKLVAEPSGAAGLAALLKRRSALEGERVGIIISGGNIDAKRFSEIIGAHDRETSSKS